MWLALVVLGSVATLLVADGARPQSPTGSPDVVAPGDLPPQGLYESCMYDTRQALERCQARLEHMAAAGFRLVLNYEGLSAPLENLLAYVDHAEAVGMKVIWNLNDPVWWTGDARSAFPELARTCGCSGNAALARYLVRKVAPRPATWGYYVGDEVSTGFKAARAHWSTVHRSDPSRPTLVVSAEDEGTLGAATEAHADADAVTVLAPDIYPIGRAANPAEDPLYSVGRTVSRVQQLADEHQKQAGAVLQAFNWKKMYPEESWLAVERFPSRDEMRAMRDDALGNGRLQLILWYSYFDLMNDDPWQQHWADLQWAAFGDRPARAAASTPPTSTA